MPRFLSAIFLRHLFGVFFGDYMCISCPDIMGVANIINLIQVSYVLKLYILNIVIF